MAAGFPQSMCLKRIRQTLHGLWAFSDQALEVMQCHFHHILLVTSVLCPAQILEEGNSISPFGEGMVSLYCRRACGTGDNAVVIFEKYALPQE